MHVADAVRVQVSLACTQILLTVNYPKHPGEADPVRVQVSCTPVPLKYCELP